jgi:hypothetical protein
MAPRPPDDASPRVRVCHAPPDAALCMGVLLVGHCLMPLVCVSCVGQRKGPDAALCVCVCCCLGIA